VILSALDGTFRREPFGPVLNLMPRAERITKLSAVCKVIIFHTLLMCADVAHILDFMTFSLQICCNEASFTRRTTDDTALEVKILQTFCF